jgi:hypothetical protein
MVEEWEGYMYTVGTFLGIGGNNVIAWFGKEGEGARYLS